MFYDPDSFSEEEAAAEVNAVLHNEDHLKDLVGIAKLLSDQTRFKLLLMIAAEGPINVTSMCDRLGESQPAVSHHLALMRMSGMVEATREGKNNFYSVRKGNKYLQSILRVLTALSLESSRAHPMKSNGDYEVQPPEVDNVDMLFKRARERIDYAPMRTQQRLEVTPGIDAQLIELNEYALTLIPEDLRSEWNDMWDSTNEKFLKILLNEGMIMEECKGFLEREIARMLTQSEESRPEA